MSYCRPSSVLLVALAISGALLRGQAEPLPERLARLKTALSQIHPVDEDGGRLWLQCGTHRLEVVGASGRLEPIARVGERRVTLAHQALFRNRTQLPEQLERAVAAADAAGLDQSEWTFDVNPLVGPHLHDAQHLVRAAGVLRAYTMPEWPAAGVGDAAEALAAKLEQSGLDHLARAALHANLAALAPDPAASRFAVPGGTRARVANDDDGIDADLVLRLIRAGWLREFLAPSVELERLEQCVRNAGTLRPTRVYRGKDTEIARLGAEDGGGAWTIRSPDRCAYLTTIHASPDLPTFELLVVLPPGSDPRRDADRATETQLFRDGERLATWTQVGGFDASEGWRRISEQARVHGAIAPGYPPPHLPLVGLDGRIVRLITAHGVVNAPRRDDPASVERFLAETATALPDAVHLDLVRIHFFDYVFDSPDPRLPTMIGTESVHGEIHQTFAQTVQTSVGGRFRGDCDDLAEVFQAICTRQGRLGHIMLLPGHNAFGFCDKGQTGIWTTHVLHTGQPLAFRHRQLDRSLERAYRHFDPQTPFDPAQVAICVRFSGENTRSVWSLGYRIFEDADYARTMIDVQRDWHYHTYRRGTTKMLRLVESGDRDPANFHELAGLAERVGRYAEAAEFVLKSGKLDDDPTMSAAMRRIANLYEAGQRETARTELRRAVHESLPRLRRQEGPAYWTILLSLLDIAVASGEDYEVAAELLRAEAMPVMRRTIEKTAAWLASSEFDRATWESPMGLEPLRNIMRGYAALAIQLIEKLASSPAHGELVHDLRADVLAWMQGIAWQDAENPRDRMFRYALVGTGYSALGVDGLDARLARAPFPASVPDKPPAKPGAPESPDVDLPWLKASVPYWFERITRLFADDRQSVDPAEVERLSEQALAANEASSRLGIGDMRFDYLAHLSRFARALVREDRAAVQARFAHVRDENDKDLREATVAWIGSAARFLRPEWFTEVLALYDHEIGYKPLYFDIAWTAWVRKAPAQALQAARLAAARFPDDDSFQEELHYMEELAKNR